MKRSFAFSTSLTVGVLALLAAAPAFAVEYTYDAGEEAAGLAFCGAWTICILIPAIVFGVLQIWMLIDAIMRQEYEFPNSSGNSKLIWILLLVLLGGSAIFYYFMVFKKIKRGSGPSAGGYQPPPAPPTMAPPPPPMAPPAPPAPPAGPTG